GRAAGATVSLLADCERYQSLAVRRELEGARRVGRVVEDDAAGRELVVPHVVGDDAPRLAGDLRRVWHTRGETEAGVVAETRKTPGAPVARVRAALNRILLLILAARDDVAATAEEVRAAGDAEVVVLAIAVLGLTVVRIELDA